MDVSMDISMDIHIHGKPDWYARSIQKYHKCHAYESNMVTGVGWLFRLGGRKGNLPEYSEPVIRIMVFLGPESD